MRRVVPEIILIVGIYIGHLDVKIIQNLANEIAQITASIESARILKHLKIRMHNLYNAFSAVITANNCHLNCHISWLTA